MPFASIFGKFLPVINSLMYTTVPGVGSAAAAAFAVDFFAMADTTFVIRMIFDLRFFVAPWLHDGIIVLEGDARLSLHFLQPSPRGFLLRQIF